MVVGARRFLAANDREPERRLDLIVSKCRFGDAHRRVSPIALSPPGDCEIGEQQATGNRCQEVSPRHVTGPHWDRALQMAVRKRRRAAAK